jgi:hypothetical protein
MHKVQSDDVDDQHVERVATALDYAAYFEIPKVIPGTLGWRAAIDQLVREIREDLETSALPKKEASDLIDSLLRVREMGT